MWYPQYGSWLISLFAEGLLLALELGYGFSRSAFVYARMSAQTCRLLILIALPTLLFSKSVGRTPSIDEESAALLGQNASSSQEPDKSDGTSRYGAIAAPPPSEANLEYEADRRKRDDEEKQKLDKRLQESGNWYRYDPHLQTNLIQCRGLCRYCYLLIETNHCLGILPVFRFSSP